MTIEAVLSLALFAFASSITPGPNNLMLLASGANFGFLKSIPHMAGVAIGFAILMISVGLGLGALLTAVPVLHLALKFAGAAYLLYLAFRIATSGSMADREKPRRAMTFLEASAFQWVNPKAWTMALTAIVVYTPADALGATLAIAVLTFLALNFPCIALWTSFGTVLKRFLGTSARLRFFNISMGVLLVASVVPMVLD
ncbi:MAG: LysE family translocator [Pseudomonadota bacterium]